jgi:aryl-alcohol dehydrogenase-like predicted oxidoreductase
MEYRRLSKTGLPVSVIGVGTWQHDVDQLLGRAGELGVNLVDTDECYGDHLAEAHAVAGAPRRASDPGACGGFDAAADRI